MDYLKETLNLDELRETIFSKSNSHDTLRLFNASYSAFDDFCKDSYKLDAQRVLADLMAEYKDNRDTKKPLMLMHSFKKWLGQDHTHIIITSGNGSKRKRKAVGSQAKKSYLSNIKKWLRLCGNIRIDNDDFRDLVAVRVSEEEEETEADPLNREEIKEILSFIKDPIKRAKFMFMKCTASRHLEALQIKKENIDFTINPPRVTFPKNIVKGKDRTRYAYLDDETKPLIKMLCRTFEDNEYIFRRKSEQNAQAYKLRNVGNQYWAFLMNSIAKKNPSFAHLNDKGNNGRLIKRIHSIRSFAMKCIEKGNNSGELGDSYGGHKKFVGKYLDKTEDERIEIFNKGKQHMSIFSEIVTVDNEELKEKYEQKFLKQEEELHYVRGMLEFVLQQNGIKFEIKDKIQA